MSTEITLLIIHKKNTATELMTDHAHVWLCDLSPLDHVDPLCLAWLDHHEHGRFKRFASLRVKNRFLASHAFMRKVLGQYLHLHPSAIDYQTSENGKPSLATHHQSSIQFSLSHSQNRIALGVHLNNPLGVDIEGRSDRSCPLDIAKRFFHPKEVKMIENADKAEQKDLFYQIWVRKEAVLKTLGHGIGDYLKGFNVAHANSNHPDIQVTDPQLKALSPVQVYDIPCSSNYAAAMACDHPIVECQVIETHIEQMGLAQLKSSKPV